jgi:hypothetical protein
LKLSLKFEEIDNRSILKEKNLKDELLKIDLNVKALWDSFTFFSDSVNIYANKNPNSN